MDFISSSRHHNSFILICCADTFTGHALAVYIATVLQNSPGMVHKDWRVRALCERIEGVADLIALDVDVQKVDYANLMVLRSHMKHVKWVVIVPGMTENQVTHAKNVIDAASVEGVKRMCMVSMMGCDIADEATPLGELRLMEDHLRSVYAYGRWCVFRHTFLHNNIIFWSRMVEQSGKMGMPMASTTEFTTIDVRDVCDAITTVILSPKKQDGGEGDDIQGIKRIYDLTGSCSYIGDDVVLKLCHAIGAEEKAIKFEELDEQSMRDYLEEMKKKPSVALAIVPSAPYIPDPQYHLEPTAIEVILGWFRVATISGMMGKVANDARDLLGRTPIDIGTFFNEQRHHFRPPSGGDDSDNIDNDII